MKSAPLSHRSSLLCLMALMVHYFTLSLPLKLAAKCAQSLPRNTHQPNLLVRKLTTPTRPSPTLIARSLRFITMLRRLNRSTSAPPLESPASGEPCGLPALLGLPALISETSDMDMAVSEMKRASRMYSTICWLSRRRRASFSASGWNLLRMAANNWGRRSMGETWEARGGQRGRGC